MPKHSSHILDLAKRGAEARYRELADELKSLTKSFPHLRDSFDRDELPVNFILRRGRDKAKATGVATPGRRRPMSAAQRKAVGLRMRKYWAARRRAAAKS
jgi:hypothetical protein